MIDDEPLTPFEFLRAEVARLHTELSDVLKAHQADVVHLSDELASVRTELANLKTLARAALRTANPDNESWRCSAFAALAEASKDPPP